MAVTVEGKLRVVFDEEDRVVETSPAARIRFGHLLGQRVWDHFPGSRSVFHPYWEEARRTGERTEGVVFYNGTAMRVLFVPDGRRLTATWEVLGTLDVTTLDALQESLEEISAVLAEHEQTSRGRARGLLRVVEGGR